MDNRYTLQDFTGFLASSSGQSKRKSEAYLRALFDIIQKGLDEDQYVKVRGFGTFKISQVNERESVNVTTGERITLGSHAKITFQPDIKLKELVNRPFSHFTTITLEETTDLDLLEQAEEPEPHAPAELSISLTEETIGQESGNETQVLPESSEPKTTDSPTVPSAIPSRLSNEENKTSVAPPQEHQAIRHTSEHSASVAGYDTPNVEDDFRLPRHPESPIIQDHLFTETNSETGTSDSENPDEDFQTDTRNCYRKWIKIAISAIVLLLLLLSSYFIGYFRILCPDCDFRLPVRQQTRHEKPVPKPVQVRQTKKNVTRQTTSADTPVSSSSPSGTSEEQSGGKTEKEALEASKAYEQLPNGEYLIVGTEGVHTVAPGEGIYRIAKKHYGKKELAPYIILHNKLKNPDLITTGTQIQLPELRKTDR